ncbi:gamma-tubulin complex component 2 isoform X1 [Babesia ovis]|uniref:Spindle pole body component n=1 Tax=Babesia ovis TaxID=5869 RepID=A0A9W5TBS1_BABOV|nr:gamma-tubulin complex component 2 isoform X1 [Babesia ovis]
MMGGELYHTCNEPVYAHTSSKAKAYFPPLISLVHVDSGGSDSIEQQLRRNWHTYTTNVKETIILEDVINVLCGSQGTVFRFDPGTYRLRYSSFVDRKNDATLCMMAEEILELAVMQQRVQEFVRENDNGFIGLSFCEVLNVLLQELQSRIAQFDDSQRKMGAGLQRLKLYLKPALHTFELLTMVTAKGNLKGAELINMLASTCQMFGTGDARRSLAGHLMKQSMEAYCYLLDPWVNHGRIYDPCQEFFIVDSGASGVESETYTIVWTRVPVVMKDIAEQILETGIYIRILSRSRGRALPASQPIQYTSMEELKETIASLHQVASDELMKHVIFDRNLMEILESLHRFFLLARADYVANMLADARHWTLHDAVNLNFQEAVAQSSLRMDPNRLLFSLEPEQKGKIEFRARSYEDLAKMVTMKFKVEWPLHIFFTDDVMAKYQAIFKFLLQLKQTEHDLANMWLMHVKWKRLPLTPSAQLRLNFIFVCIERMLFFCRNIAYLSTIEITERSFNLMLQKYENHLKTTNADQSVSFVIQQHRQFVDQVVKDSMIDDNTVGPYIHRALSLCVLFATQVIAFLDQYETDAKDDHSAAVEQATNFASELLHNHGYIAMVETASTQFDKHLRDLVAVLEGDDAKYHTSLLLRLNYNGFFK